MKFKFTNPCAIHIGAIVVEFIITGLLLTTENHTASGIATTITFITIASFLSWAVFPTPYKEVRPRNILRIIIMVILFHTMPTLFTYGLNAIDILCKTDHPKKISETVQKSYHSLKTPMEGIKEHFSEKSDETPKEAAVEQATTEETTEEDPLKDYFSYAYIIFIAGIVVSLYNILFSWSGSAFLVGIGTLIGLLIWLNWMFTSEIGTQWKVIWSMAFMIPMGITAFLGKDNHTSPATY